MYFDFSDRCDIHEDFLPRQFVNAYDKTKFQAEQLVRNSSKASVIIRPRGIFGEYDQVLIPRLLRVVEKSSPPLVKRLGKPAGSVLLM